MQFQLSKFLSSHVCLEVRRIKETKRWRGLAWLMIFSMRKLRIHERGFGLFVPLCKRWDHCIQDYVVQNGVALIFNDIVPLCLKIIMNIVIVVISKKAPMEQ